MQTPSKTSDARRLLIAYAHPDDESFGLGGTIARYAQAGVEVHLICATNGDLGDVPESYLARYGSVPEVRLAELHCAAEKLGIHQVHTFGYRDSGMMGAPENDHPDCLWQADMDTLTGQVVDVMRRVRPQVVITFDPYGGYGHPDHIAIHRAALRAFHEAGDDAHYPEQIAAGLAPFQPSRLYYSVFPRLMVRLGVWVARLRGEDPRRMGNNNDLDFQAVLDATLPSHARLDIRAFYDDWQEASACHASQQSLGNEFTLPRFIQRQVFGWQSFYRAWPEANGSARLERDLFNGVG